jgi:hypothetical protein
MTAAPATLATANTEDTTAEVTTTTTVVWDQDQWIVEDGPAALALIEDYYAALNAGDVATGRDLVERSTSFAQPFEVLPLAVDGVGARFVFDCSVSESQPRVMCHETVTDSLCGPAGIALEGSVSYRVTDEGLLATEESPGHLPVCVGDPPGDAARFLLGFYEWVVDTHQDLKWVWTGDLSTGVLGISCTPYPLVNAQAATNACDIVPEFIAQSDIYPRPERLDGHPQPAGREDVVGVAETPSSAVKLVKDHSICVAKWVSEYPYWVKRS